MYRFSKMLIFFCIFIFLNVHSVSSVPTGNPCLAPDNIQGICISLAKCPALLKLLQDARPNFDDLQYLQKATCDRSSGDPKVCCPGAKTTTTTSPTTTTEKIGSSHEISEHSNLHLLPDSSTCGISKAVDTNRIANGQDAGLGTYPWMVLIGYSEIVDGKETELQYACGGTLINPKYVLTAAHCVTHLPTGFSPKVVKVGEYNQATPLDCAEEICAPKPQLIPIDHVVPHPEYDANGKKANDIALIRLAQNVAYGPFVGPICLPHGETLRKTEKTPVPIVAGWGRLTSQNPKGSDVLQQVKVPFVSNVKCKEVYESALGAKVDAGRFCAGGEFGKDSCQGDSGGPLMVILGAKKVDWKPRVFQFGVVSLGPENCESSHFPALYTNVAHFMPWILKNLSP